MNRTHISSYVQISLLLIAVVVAGCGAQDLGANPPPSQAAPTAAFTVPATSTYAGGDTRLEVVGDALEPSELAWNATCGRLAVNGLSATYTAPTTPGVCTITVYLVENLGTATRARTASTPQLLASIDVTVTPPGTGIEVHTMPGQASVTTGSTLAISSHVEGIERQDVSWSSTCGTLFGEGDTVTFTAPDEPAICTVTAASLADPSRTGTTLIDVAPRGEEIAVRLRPSAATVWAGDMLPLLALVGGTSNPDVTWSASCGDVYGMGVDATFFAPMEPGVCTVTVTSAEDARAMADAQVTVRAFDTPTDLSLSPIAVTVDVNDEIDFEALIANVDDPAVDWTATCGTIVADDSFGTFASGVDTAQFGPIRQIGAYTAPSQPGTCIVTATSLENGQLQASSTVTVTAPSTPVTIDVNPTSSTLRTGESATFVATVAGTDDTRVAWSATCGAFTGDGGTIGYVAPDSEGTCTIEVTSLADPTVTATATATILQPVTVTVSPNEATLFQGETRAFDAIVTGASNDTVTWTVTCGQIDGEPERAYVTAPNQAGRCNLTATSVEDPNRSYTAILTIADPASLTLKPTQVTLAPGATRSFEVQVANLQDSSVTWTTTCDGTFTPAGSTASLTAGASEQTCSVDVASVAQPSLTASSDVTIARDPAISNVTLSPADVEIELGASVTLYAVVDVVGGADASVTWTSNDPSIATVDESGQVSSVALGTTTIRATSTFDASKYGEATVHVVEEPRRASSATLTADPTTLETGETATITITLFDQDGARYLAGGDFVTVDTTLGTLTSVEDRGDGTYRADLTSSNDGTATVTGTLNGSTLGDQASVTFTVPPAATPAFLEMGYLHAFAGTNGGVIAWGNNSHGQAGNGSTATPVTPSPSFEGWDVAGVAAGEGFTLGLLADGGVVSVGLNAYGQLGDGTQTNRSEVRRVSGITNAIAVSAGKRHSVALLADGTVLAWGHNGSYQLGNGTRANASRPTPVPGLSNVTAISAGDNHTIALLENGTVATWGYNWGGQIGDGSTTSRASPFTVQGVGSVTHVAAGDDHTLVRHANGTVSAWGTNWAGQIGDGSTARRLTPRLVPNVTNAASVAAGFNHSLALLDDGTLLAWGFNGVGGVGDGTTQGRTIPTPVAGLNDVIDVKGGLDASTAMRSDGSVWAWGNRNQRINGSDAQNHVLSPVCIAHCP